MDFYKPIFFLIIAIFSKLLTSFFTPFVINFAKKYNFYDPPNLRKQHKKPAIRLGGIAIYFGVLISVAISIFISSKFLNVTFNQNELLAIFILTFVFFIIGVIDDIITINPFSRLFFQIVICGFISTYFFSIKSIYIEFLPSNINQIYISQALGVLLSSIWISGVVNAINWIDGVDGLAIGVVSLSSLTMGIFNIINQNIPLAILSLCTFGAGLGFLKFNKFPSKIMMGDSGSYFFGSIIAILSLFSFNNSAQESSFNIIPPLLILFLPIADMVLVMIRRFKKNSSIFLPDRSHIHHKLLELNLTVPNIVNILYLVNIWFCISALYFLSKKLIIILFFYTFFMVTKIRKISNSN